MNAAWIALGPWLLRSALAGSTLLLLACVLMRCTRQPARRQRLGEWGVGAALLTALLSLGPTWLAVDVPTWATIRSNSTTAAESDRQARPGTTSETTEAELRGGPYSFDREYQGSEPNAADADSDSSLTPPSESINTAPARSTESAALWICALALASSWFGSHWAEWLIIAYAVGLAFFAGRWLIGTAGLYRFLRTCRPAPDCVIDRLGALCGCDGRTPRLLVSERLRTAVSCGILRPTIVIPSFFCEPVNFESLRWAFAHEWTHLERLDPCSRVLFGLGQAVFFYCPWFWWLRRQVCLCQEYVADAVAAQAAGWADEYAQFLVSLAEAPAGPQVAIGVAGNRSDLFRRVTMLLKNPMRVESCCPWRWSLAAALGLFASAVLVSGVGFGAASVPDKTLSASADDEQPDPKPKEKQRRIIIRTDGPETPGAGERRHVIRIEVDGKDIDVESLRKALENLPQSEDVQKLKKELLEKVEKIKADTKAHVKELKELKDLKDLRGVVAGETLRGLAQLQRDGQRWSVVLAPHEGRLGVHVSKPSAALAEQLDLQPNRGLVIDTVVPDSPAAKAGLKKNDILIIFGGKRVSSDPNELHKLIAGLKAGEKQDATVVRKGKEKDILGITLGEAEAEARPGQPRGRRFGPGGAGIATPPGTPGAPVPGVAPPNVPVPPGAPGRPGRIQNRIGGPGGATGSAGSFATASSFGPGTMVMTSVMRNDDHFTGRHQEGSLIVTVTGKVADGKAKVSQIHVQDGRVNDDYSSLAKVPERYQDKVKNLVKMCEQGKVEVRSGAKR